MTFVKMSSNIVKQKQHIQNLNSSLIPVEWAEQLCQLNQLPDVDIHQLRLWFVG